MSERTTQDLIENIIDKKPAFARDIFDELIAEKIQTVVAEHAQIVAESMFKVESEDLEEGGKIGGGMPNRNVNPPDVVTHPIRRDHDQLKALSTKQVHKHHQNLRKVSGNYTPAEVGGKQGMIDDILRAKHGSKILSQFYSTKTESKIQEVQTKENN